MFEIEYKKGLSVFKVELKRATYKDSEEFKEFLVKELQNKPKGVVIDLSQCEFIDSAFLGSILYGSKIISNNGGELRLVACHMDTEALLDLTGISKLIQVYESVNEAEKSLKIS